MRPAASSSPMLTRLALETCEHHDRADQVRYGPMATPTLAGYRTFLARVSVFEFAVEAALVRQLALPAGLLHRVIKSGGCTDDLLWLGPTPESIAIAAKACHVPRMTDVAQALGWIYMLERNRLGSDDVLAAVQRSLPHAYQTASRYLRACSEHQEERWCELGTYLERSEPARVIVAARQAFERHHRWYTGKTQTVEVNLRRVPEATTPNRPQDAITIVRLRPEDAITTVRDDAPTTVDDPITTVKPPSPRR
jgi:heme oxygenase